MKFRPLFDFFGGALFALTLLFVAAVVIAWATYLEAKYDSHLVAADAVYRHPFFTLLLCLFFVNILFAALRRWPFQKKHTPFLLTHLGLLLVLSGVIAKNMWGLQGNLGVWEGSGSHQISLPETHSLLLETKERRRIFLPLPQGEVVLSQGKLRYRALSLASNSSSSLAGWFHGDALNILNTPPVPIGEVHTTSSSWQIHGQKGGKWEDAAKKAYLNDLWMVLRNEEEEISILLEEALQQSFSWHGEKIAVSLKEWEEETPYLVFPLLQVPLSGSNALFLFPSISESLPFSVSLKRPPLLFFHEDDRGTTRLLAADPFGRISQHTFSNKEQQPITVYDGGFEGYTLSHILPFFYHPSSPQERMAIRKKMIEEELCKAKQGGVKLAYPLQQWDEPEKHLPHLLEEWHSPSLSPYAIAAITSWKGAPGEISFEQKRTLIYHALSDSGITPSLLYPPMDEEQECSLLAACSSKPHERMVLETPLRPHYLHEEKKKQREANTPLLTMELSQGKRTETISLRYDEQGTGIRWPIFDGDYLASFVPKKIEIPYHVRLREARERYYPQTNQPYSYECGLWVTDRRTGKEKQVEMSMNHVYATDDGYRFYLANIHTSSASGIHLAHLIVNYDPFKRWLTSSGELSYCIRSLLVVYPHGEKTTAMKYWITFLFFLVNHVWIMSEVPVYYEGRIRPLSAVSNTIQEDLLLLPGEEGIWYPLSALPSATNMTLYPDPLFQEMESLSQNEERLIQRLEEGYLSLAGTPFLKSPNRTVYYPQPWVLRLEAFYVKTPLLLSITILYALAFLLLLLKKRWGYAFS